MRKKLRLLRSNGIVLTHSIFSESSAGADVSPKAFRWRKFPSTFDRDPSQSSQLQARRRSFRSLQRRVNYFPKSVRNERDDSVQNGLIGDAAKSQIKTRRKLIFIKIQILLGSDSGLRTRERCGPWMRHQTPSHSINYPV